MEPSLTPHRSLSKVRRLASLVSALVVGTVLACGGSERSAPGSTPNLIVALVDTTRADHLGFQGYSLPTSPRLDDLARESVVFANHYSHASRTGPAVASIFTGLHPRSHGVVNPLTHWDAKGTLAPDQTTLAELLREQGYATFGIVGNRNLAPRFGFDQGFDHYEFVTPNSASNLNRAVFALELERAPRPFFLYLHYMDPHSPYDAASPYDRMFGDETYDGPVSGAHQQLDQVIAGALELDAQDRVQLTALYDQELRSFDAHFGELLDHLDEVGFLEDSIVVVLADHGEELLDHGSVLHGYTLYEEQLRVPMLIRDPRQGAGRRVEAISRHVDVLPTLLALLGLGSDVPTQGRNLAARITEAQVPEDVPVPVYAQASLRAVRTVQRTSFMLEGWKLIETQVPSRNAQLFDLRKDPGEQHDLIELEPEQAERMRIALRSFEASLPIGKGGVVTLSDDEMEQLRALGYRN